MTDPENPEEKVPTAPDVRGGCRGAENEFSPETVVGNLVKEAQEMRDRLLRTLAEMENLRKRTEREVADARSHGVASFARDILDIADNMHRALEAVPVEARSSDDGGLKALVEGVELTERALAKALEKHGVKRFDPAGEKFDPNLHQAMYEVPDPSVAARHRRAGDPARLHDRRSRVASGHGRGGEGRRQSSRRPKPRSSRTTNVFAPRTQLSSWPGLSRPSTS